MGRTMLINATRPRAVRGAILDERGRLVSYEIDVAEAGLARGNVYLGTVANIEPALNAAFIDYGGAKQGFLPIGDIAPDSYHGEPKDEGRIRIDEVLRRRRRILVQVVRDAVGHKGAALTTYVALAGRFVVFTPRDDAQGISRKIEDEDERRRIRKVISEIQLPKGAGLIVRTSAAERSKEELEKDVLQLLEEWDGIERRANDKKTKVGTCLHQEDDLVIRMLRDQYATDIDTVWVDTSEAHAAALEYFHQNMPDHAQVVKLWERSASLFAFHKAESQIAAIYERKVPLPSGGSLVIEPTEALTVIDVNSGRSTSQGSQAETAYQTNLEAADEIARQLRLRDLGGLVVVDFIDMAQRKHQRAVEKRVKDALKSDRARTYIGSISENGLLEINRQRIRQALRLQTHQACTTCGGSGIVRGSDFAAMHVLRTVEERAIGGTLRDAHIDLHPSLAEYLQNRYRGDLAQIEETYQINITIHGRPGMHLSDEEFVWRDKPREEIEAALAEEGAEGPNKAAAGVLAVGAAAPGLSAAPHHPEAPLLTPAPADDEDDEEGDEPTSGAGAEAEGQGRGRRRRRRRKRGGREGAEAPAPRAERPQAAPPAERAGAAERPDGAPAEPRDEGDAAGGRARRGRGRRRGRGGRGEAQPGSTPAEAASPSAPAAPAPNGSNPAEGGSAPSAGRRRRSRRRRGGRGSKPDAAGESPSS